MPVCLLAAGKTTLVAASAFTLSWTHSVEKVRWEEQWRLTPAGFDVVEARIRGSGAGMDPPDGSVLRDGWWVYRPDVKPVPAIVLAASGATGSGWTLCGDGTCREIGASAGDPLRLAACNE